MTISSIVQSNPPVHFWLIYCIVDKIAVAFSILNIQLGNVFAYWKTSYKINLLVSDLIKYNILDIKV